MTNIHETFPGMQAERVLSFNARMKKLFIGFAAVSLAAMTWMI